MKWEIGKASPEDLGGEMTNHKTGEKKCFSWFIRFHTELNQAQFVIPYQIIRDIYTACENAVLEDEEKEKRDSN